MTARSCAFGVGILLAVGSVPLPSPLSLVAQDTTAGKKVYVKWCAGCHGETGAGDGPAAPSMLPRPRNFTGAIYKIRTTASGQLPTDADVMRAIDDGLPGSAMPAWKGRLSDAERRNVMAYLKTFSSFFADTSQHVTALKFSSEPSGGTDTAALNKGRRFYEDSIHCNKCHGDQGRGDGPSAPTLKDDAGFPIYAADLHQNWRFRGGPTVADIYRRLRTGLDGTPMPSFSDLIDQKFLTDEELWRLAQYVRSLSPTEAPEVRDVIHAPQLTGALPVSPDDSAWARVDRYWFPLVGQVIHKSRWFAPAASGVWVQALHNGRELALRVSWDDRSQSPDTAWLAFEQRVLATVASDDSPPPKAEPWPDQLAVQFPRKIPGGMERPYFLMGAATDPVYQWRWTSQPRRAVAGLARGIDQFDTLPSPPAAQAVYDHGEWRVLFTRALATPDTADDVQLETGRAIPVAFFAWDGSSGEHGSRMAVSTWYFLALDRPTPVSVFVSPVIAMVVTLGLGTLVVVRAQRRSGRGASRAGGVQQPNAHTGGMMHKVLGLVGALGVTLLAGGACGGGGKERAEGATATASSTAVAQAAEAPSHADAQGGATITGKVKFVGKAPANPVIDMSEEPKCKAKYTAPPREQIVEVNPNGTLADAFVYVKAGLAASYKAPAPTGPVTLDQDGCRYHPHVFGILVGQTLAIKNSDGILHNIKAKAVKNRPFNISQPTTMTSERAFSAPEVMVPLECNVHGWMHAWLGVLPHPFFGVSGTDGSYTIRGLPPGTYTIEAWHEKYGTQTATVTVTGSETKTADFSFAAK